MSVLEALILGLLQGLTEFLPVSSSGHIELGKAILGVELSDSLQFSLIVHFATVLSTIVVFRKDILLIIQGILKFDLNPESSFALKILLSMIPVTIVGLFFEDAIESLFNANVFFVGCMLLITGLLLLLTTIATKDTGEVSYKQAILIGISQAIAVLPGISRSGATISTGLLLGVSKDKIARFSFLMVMPPIIGKTLLDTIELMSDPSKHSMDINPLLVGFLAAFFTGLLACKWMISLVKGHRIQYFAYYCFAVGTIAIVVSCF